MDYNLNDGEGVINEIISSVTLVTSTSAVPSGEILATASTTSTLSVNYSFIDDDVVSSEQYLRLYLEGVFVKEEAITTGEGQSFTFTKLKPNTGYVVQIESTYDLNDLDGVQANTMLDENTRSTDSLLTIASENLGEKRNELEIIFDDYEDIVSGTITATLFQGALEIDTYFVSVDAITTLDMINLLSNYDYSLVIEVTYDLDDGNGDVFEEVFTHTFTTVELSRPEVNIGAVEDWDSSSGDLIVEIEVLEDTDNVIDDDSWVAVLYEDGIAVLTIDIDDLYGNPENGTVAITFTGYDHNDAFDYTILIQADVDMNEVVGEGAILTDLASRTVTNAGN